MNAKDAYTLLETLLDGIDPLTGEMLPEEHVCQEPAVLRALHRALVALQNEADADDEANAADERKTRYPRAGRPWTQGEDEMLREMYGRGETDYRIGKALGRSSYAVFRRIINLGIIRTGECPPADEEEDTPTPLPAVVSGGRAEAPAPPCRRMFPGGNRRGYASPGGERPRAHVLYGADKGRTHLPPPAEMSVRRMSLRPPARNVTTYIDKMRPNAVQ